ncbi:HNH endonuclease [Ruthenibacterium sp. CLA-JM-H11]|uniref:HNH endonuclease n=1 Tax=Ruthenibacterium intestinale TaxID=3133163 RepID=A0ABV1GIX2_9FIRM
MEKRKRKKRWPWEEEDEKKTAARGESALAPQEVRVSDRAQKLPNVWDVLNDIRAGREEKSRTSKDGEKTRRQPNVWDVLDDIRAQRGEKQAELDVRKQATPWTFQARPLDETGNGAKTDRQTAAGMIRPEEIIRWWGPTTEPAAQAGQELVRGAQELADSEAFRDVITRWATTPDPQVQMYQQMGQTLAKKFIEEREQKRNVPFSIPEDDPRLAAQEEIKKELYPLYDVPVPVYDPEDSRPYETRKAEKEEIIRELEERYDALDVSMSADRIAVMEAILGPDGLRKLALDRQEILEEFRRSPNYAILCKDYDDITAEEYARLSDEEIHALNRLQFMLREMAENKLAELLDPEQILGFDFATDAGWKETALGKVERRWQEAWAAAQGDIDQATLIAMKRQTAGLIPGTEVYDREVRHFVLNYFSPDSELYQAALLYTMIDGMALKDLDAFSTGFDHTMASAPEAAIYLGSSMLGSGQEAQRVLDGWAVADQVQRQAPMGYAAGALAGNAVLYAVPGKAVEKGAAAALAPFINTPAKAFGASVLSQTAADLMLQTPETVARGLSQGLTPAEISEQVLMQQGMNLLQNAAMTGAEQMFPLLFGKKSNLDTESRLADNGIKTGTEFTYRVPESAVWDSVETQQALANIDACLQRNGNFDDVLDDYAQIYAVNVHSNKKWSWEEDVPDGLNVKNYQQREIKARAVELGLIPDVEVKKQPGMRYGVADFRSAGLVYRTAQLPKEMWGWSNARQFKWLNEQVGGPFEGFTWHHSEIPGLMELVPSGIHNVTTHNGGRSPGMWAELLK